ncbi:hypothetical protein [Geminocystis sp. NIES-3709]|nr:hypothetical protein [Geminocystis sp. NIES-3709]BAQ63388.1 hypothetical protein GM3709_153 [Geminocystis sp. NIES-3709]
MNYIKLSFITKKAFRIWKLEHLSDKILRADNDRSLIVMIP